LLPPKSSLAFGSASCSVFFSRTQAWSGNLGNDTKKRRRFVWDEMYFLEWWWDNRATPAQQAAQQF
jgi:hypothetical protein